MLKDLTKDDWLSILNISPDLIPPTLILWGTRNLKSRYATIKTKLTNVLEINPPNGVIEDVIIGEIDGSLIGYGSVYGAPMASEVTHIFGVLGTSSVIQIGTCGGIADSLIAGDLFIAESAYCGEGASQYYKADGKDVSATPQLERFTAEHHPDISLNRGRLYTTSALFAEGMDDINRWYTQGFAAIDMETAATFAVAEYFKMDRGCLLAVFDNPRQMEHILANESEKSQRRMAAQERMLELAFSYAQNNK